MPCSRPWAAAWPQRSFAVLKPGGRAAFIASGSAAPEPPRGDLTALRPRVGRDRPHLLRILELVEAGAVRVPEIRTFPLADAASALATSAARHLRGKLGPEHSLISGSQGSMIFLSRGALSRAGKRRRSRAAGSLDPPLARRSGRHSRSRRQASNAASVASFGG